jgi:hypothetical protein
LAVSGGSFTKPAREGACTDFKGVIDVIHGSNLSL